MVKEKIRVVDYIAQTLSEHGVKEVFTITGGGAMFINDAILKHPEIKAVCGHHEQASAMSAVGYSKYTGKISVVMPTTGCASTNTITGLLDAWQDNVPVVFISGQVNSNQTVSFFEDKTFSKLRQFGVQEADIVEIVSSLTKYSVMVTDPKEIKYHLEKALHIATSGRQGPVWLDIPLNVQSAYIDVDSLDGYNPPPFKHEKLNYEDLQTYFKDAERPILLIGNGVRLAGAEKSLVDFAEHHNIPVVCTYLAADIMETDNLLNIGRVGIKGNRAANFALQNSDLVLAIGTRLGVPVTGYIYENFAREANLIVVDIDDTEHKKDTVKIEKFVHADAKEFLDTFKTKVFPVKWASKCYDWKEKWPIFLQEHFDDTDGISFYGFMSVLSDCSRDDDVFVSDAGSAYYVSSQSVHIKKNQRYITSGAQADMGFTLPAAIGVCVGKNNGDVIGIVGDGSFQMNIQELQTMVHNNFPIKMFVWNNNGYLSIKTTQRKFFNDGFIGTGVDTGVSFPELEKIAFAYGIKYVRASEMENLANNIKQCLDHDGPVICEVICKEWDEVLPTIASKKLEDGRMFSKPLEDMYPLLPRTEFLENMIVEPLKEI
jgi:acetolactate synthase-1/2/3 large subunit